MQNDLIERLKRHAANPFTGPESAALFAEAIAALESKPAPEVAAWIPVSERLPENGRHVLAFTRASVGLTRRIRAFHCDKHSISADEETIEHDGADYLEEEDEFYLKPGWYEENEYAEYFFLVTDPVTHWMPLPPPPAVSQPQSRAEYSSTHGEPHTFGVGGHEERMTIKSPSAASRSPEEPK